MVYNQDIEVNSRLEGLNLLRISGMSDVIYPKSQISWIFKKSILDFNDTTFRLSKHAPVILGDFWILLVCQNAWRKR